MKRGGVLCGVCAIVGSSSDLSCRRMLWAIMQRKRVINGDVDSAQEYAARKLNIGMQRERERERERERLDGNDR